MAKKLSESEVITKIEQKFPNKFDFSKWEFQGMKQKVILICKDCGSIIEVTPAYLTASKTKYGCKYCYLNNKKSKQEEVIEKIKNIYGESTFDFSEFNYVDARTEVTLICKRCGNKFTVIPNDLTRKRHVLEPCRECYKKSKTKSQDTFIKEVLQRFNNKFDFSKCTYVSAKTPVTLICTDCGTEFTITPDNLLVAEYGCPKCAEISRRKSRTKTTEQFIKEAKEIHGDKYDYSKTEYIDCNTRVCITCPKHGEFWQLPPDHICNKSGCPKCNRSKGENLIDKILTDTGINYINQYELPLTQSFNKIFVDFYLPKYNTIIEYNGIQHYQPVEFFGGEEHFNNYQIPRDNQVKEYCKNNSINLIIIKYTLKDNEIKEIILDFINSYEV